MQNSFYYAEELHITEYSPKNIVVTDRATLFNLLIGLDGYTISSGILSEDLNGSNITAVPLESTEIMEIGYISPNGRTLIVNDIKKSTFRKDVIYDNSNIIMSMSGN